MLCKMISCIKNDKISIKVYYDKRLKQSALSGSEIHGSRPVGPWIADLALEFFSLEKIQHLYYFLDFTDLIFLSRSSQLAFIVIYHILPIFYHKIFPLLQWLLEPRLK